MATGAADEVETLTLRFQGEAEDGTKLHELRAAHVAEVLQGLVALSSDFTKAGALGDNQAGAELLVRPAQEGSFLIEVVRWAAENPELAVGAVAVTGLPTLGKVIWWSTKSVRAAPKDIEHLPNGNVKVLWQDDTVDEIPPMAWQELNKHHKRRKKQLRQIMAPLSDPLVSSLEVEGAPAEDDAKASGPETAFTLARPDYDAVRPPEEEVTEEYDFFETEAQMSAVDFDNPGKWRVKTASETRAATVEDAEFLGRVARGLAIRNSDIFRLRIRRDTVVKNGRKRTTWTVVRVESYRRAANDDDS